MVSALWRYHGRACLLPTVGWAMVAVMLGGTGHEPRPASPAAGPDDEVAARRVLAVHVPQQWPAGQFCANCRQRHPCRMHRWARAVLCAAGWTDSAIEALDPRTGAWS